MEDQNPWAFMVCGHVYFVPAHPEKNEKLMTNAQTSCKHIAKVGSYGRFDLKIGIGLKFPAKSTPLELHSSHGDPFRDQKRFQK